MRAPRGRKAPPRDVCVGTMVPTGADPAMRYGPAWEERSPMTSLRRALQAFGYLSFVGGADLLITIVVLCINEQPSYPGLCLLALTAFCAFVLGGNSIGVVRGERPAIKLLPQIVIALLVNVADIAVALTLDQAVVAALANALICLGVAATAHLVNREQMGTRS